MSLSPNQQLFEYRIMRILGQGDFGIVYLAHDTLLNRMVTDSKERSGRLPFFVDPVIS